MPAYRHRPCLENGITLGHSPQPLPADIRHNAQHKFHRIIDKFKDEGANGYNRPLLLEYTYEYSLTDLSKDGFLRAFFGSLGLDFMSEQHIDLDDTDLGEKVVGFADFILEKFYLPRVSRTASLLFFRRMLILAYSVKSTCATTPQPSPAHLSAVQRASEALHELTVIQQRLSTLRSLCLLRDHHRCVISHAFDRLEQRRRREQYGDEARDDEGNLLQLPYGFLEVAHILPHSLSQSGRESQLVSLLLGQSASLH